jgi:uncharacterized membrane protein YtjA (UPF0391 family)
MRRFHTPTATKHHASQAVLRAPLPSGENTMLKWAIIFAVVSLITGWMGFRGVSGATATIAKVLFVCFLILFVLALLAVIGVLHLF